jgi:PBP1b-binding outer membrane lipoprotein LpoB
MHKKLTLFSTVLVALWLAGCSHSPTPTSKVAQQPTPQASSTQGSPAAVVTEAEFDFGAVSEGNDYVHDFKIANQGDAVLEIIKVLPA